MVIHSIISEFDIFFIPPQYEQQNQSNIIPCVTNPAEFLKPAVNPYYTETQKRAGEPIL